MTIAEMQELYAFNRWANRRMLRAVLPLSPEQFAQDMGSSFPSVRDTLVHILAAEWVWLSRWKGISPRELPVGWNALGYEDLHGVWLAHEAEQTQFLEQLTDIALARSLAYTNTRGEPFTVPLRHLLRHVVNHSTYHRGQVTTMLRQLGHTASATDLVLYHTSGGAE